MTTKNTNTTQHHDAAEELNDTDQDFDSAVEELKDYFYKGMTRYNSRVQLTALKYVTKGILATVDGTSPDFLASARKATSEIEAEVSHGKKEPYTYQDALKRDNQFDLFRKLVIAGIATGNSPKMVVARAKDTLVAYNDQLAEEVTQG